MTQNHLGYLHERQVASTMILVLILSSQHFNISVLGVVVRGAKKHHVNVKTEQNLKYFIAKELAL